MKLYMGLLQWHLVTAVTFALVLASAGPGQAQTRSSTTTTIPAGGVAYYNVSFLDGRHTVRVVSDDNPFIDVTVSDSDGHSFKGAGIWRFKTVRLNVYRPGTFYIEIHNFSIRDSAIMLRAN